MGLQVCLGRCLIVFALAGIVYLTLIMMHRQRTTVDRGTNMRAYRSEMLICLAFMVFALDIRLGFPGVAGWIIRIPILCFLLLIIALVGMILSGMRPKRDNRPDAELVIVLGMALENGKPTGDLIARLCTAAGYMRLHPLAGTIVTGGNRSESSESEADVMRHILIEQRIEEHRILVEDRSVDTVDNFRNIARMVNPSEPCVLVTSSYHMRRAAALAKEAGFSSVQMLPAKPELLFLPANLMWETVCLAEHILTGKVHLSE